MQLHSKAVWIDRATEVHYAAGWFVRHCICQHSQFTPARIQEICMSFVENILPRPGSAPIAAGSHNSGFGSASPENFGSDYSPPCSPVEGLASPDNDGAGAAAGAAAPQPTAAAAVASTTTTSVPDITKGWWGSTQFRIVRQQYTFVASSKGKNLPGLLTALNVSDQATEGLNSAQASPSPFSAGSAHLSPLATPTNATPNAWPTGTLPESSVSPSPPAESSPDAASSPRSDASGDARAAHVADPRDVSQQPRKRARLE